MTHVHYGTTLEFLICEVHVLTNCMYTIFSICIHVYIMTVHVYMSLQHGLHVHNTCML